MSIYILYIKCNLPRPCGYNAWLPCMRLQVKVSAGSSLAGWPGRYINVQWKDPLDLSIKRREFLPGSRFISRRDMTWAVKSDRNTNSVLRP